MEYVEEIEEDEDTLLLAMLLSSRRRMRSRPRKQWAMRMYQQRKRKGAFRNLIQEMRRSDWEAHFRYDFSLVLKQPRKIGCVPPF